MTALTQLPRTKVFISYCHADTEWLERLRVHLKPLERTGVIDRWDDTRTQTGERWREKINEALASAKVAVLLISPDFLASDFIANEELPHFLAAEEAKGLVIMPVILRPCRFKQTPSLSQFQAVNRDLRPLIEMTEGEQDALWVKLTDDIVAALSSHPC